MNTADSMHPDQIALRLRKLQRDGLRKWENSEVETYHSSKTGHTLIVLTFDDLHFALTTDEATQLCTALTQIPDHIKEATDTNGKDVLQ